MANATCARFLTEFLYFGIKEARSCLFVGLFFAAVFLFITRCVVLAFLMVTSPIGFAGMAIPPLHEMATKWWDQLLKQSFFAPIFILLILSRRCALVPPY